MAKRGSKRGKGLEERTPPSGDRPRAPRLPEPARGSGEDLLPVVALGSVDMEKFCRGLVRVEYPHLSRAELKRDRGQQQFGADVEGFDPTQRPVVVVSCKCYHDAQARDLLPWTRQFTDHLHGHWQDKGVKTFVLAVTCDGNDDEMNAAAQQVSQHLLGLGIAFDFWTNQKMSDLARKDPGLVGSFFSRYWHDVFLPRSEGSEVVAASGTPVTSLTTASAIAALSKDLIALLSERDRAFAKRIDEAQTAFRAGRVSSLKACLDDIQDSSAWLSMDGNVRAKALRARALLALHEGNGEAALRLIDDADTLAVPSDRSLRAMVMRITSGAQAAIAFLDAARSERETEAKASLLLELGEIDKALAELSRAPADRPECQRLKSIALCLEGKREQAVALAEEALNAEPHSVLAQQTVAILHVMAALSPGAEVQFGSIPNPIDPGLVRGTQDALDHLEKAEAQFSHLTRVLEPPSKAEVEIWRFASLILHADKRNDARKFAHELLARESVEPVAVAWSRLARLPIRVGYIRKLLTDALRQQRGSPSHIVVDALLAADKDGPSAALAIIDRYAGQFPRAAEFLEGWRERFAGGSGDDIVFAALHAPDTPGRFEKLAHQINAGTHTDDTVLAAAEIMAGNGAWSEISSIQERLTEVRTPRAIMAAAHAAFNTGTPEETLRILDAFKTSFRHGELPPSLIELKARAHDALGDKSSAIAGYEEVLARTNQPRARKRLVQTYLAVGNLGSARHHAEKLVFGKAAHPTDAVAFADVWKGADPEFSRRLVMHAASDPRLPVQAAPHAYALAIELGLKDIEARLAPIVLDVEKHGAQTGVIAIDSVEALVAHMNARAEGIRQRLSAWLAGHQWSHGTWSNDLRTFALLYLGEPEDRYDSIGQKVPMLLSSAGVDRPDPVVGEDKPVLVMDISGLLLAARLQLVDALCAAFTIKVPEAVPAAILEIEKALPLAAETVLDASRLLLSDGGLRLVQEAPIEATPLEDLDDPSNPNSDVLAKVLAETIKRGQLDQATAERAAKQFAIHPRALVAEDPPGGLLISRGLLLKLAQAGVLEPICRTIRTYWTVRERAKLAAEVAQCERMKDYRGLLSTLRGTVAQKLQDNSWRALPKRFDPQWNKQREGVRPHLLSLLETAGALESGLEGLYWIEDRYVQRWTDARLVSVAQILRLLTDRGVLTTTEHDARLIQLRRMGYGFQLPNIDAMVRDIRSAPIETDQQLVETPTLALWRAWFAGEVEHLQYCDLALVRDADGRIIGEARHTLDIVYIAREVIWAIWREPDQTDLEKVLRSMWVWSNLRVEQMPFFPVVAASPTGATALVALCVAHIADVPLLSLMQGEEATRGPAKSFLPWLFNTIIDPRSSIDPAFEAEFEAHLRRTVIAALGWADGNLEGTELESVRGHIRRRVGEYVELLPTRWRDRLLTDHELAQQLQATAVLTAHLAELEFDAVQLAEAITTALSSIGVQGEIEQKVQERRGRNPTLRVKGNGEVSPTVTLEWGEKILTMDRVMTALHLADVEKRSQELLAAESDLDGPPEDRTRRLRTLAELGSVADRIEGLRVLHKKDFSLACKRVCDGVRRRRDVDRSDLSLPAPTVLQAYLRIAQGDGEEAAALPDLLFARLENEVGAEEAVARLGGFPFKPGPKAIARIAHTLKTAIDENRLEQIRPDTALETLMYVRGAAELRHDGSQVVETLTVRLLDQLTKQAPLFIALLSQAERQAERDAGWAKLPQELAAPLMWVWADRLTAALIVGGADPDVAAKLISDNEMGRLADMIDVGSTPGWWRETVRTLDDGRLIAGVVGEIAEITGMVEVGPDTQKRLLEAGGHFLGEAWMPRLDASFPPEQGPAGYWPAEDAVQKVAASTITKMLGPFDIREASEYTRALFVSDTNDAQLPGMLAVLSFINVSRLNQACLQLAYGSMSELLKRSTASPTNPGYRRGLAILAGTLALTGTTKEGEDLIAAHAREMAARWPDVAITEKFFEDQTEPHQGLSMLVEMVLAFARNRGEPLLEKVRWIGVAIETIVDAWPKSVRGAVTFLERSIERLPVKEAAPLWPLFNRYRARR